MTNREKFIEVFGVEPNTEYLEIEGFCQNYEHCKYASTTSWGTFCCKRETWWQEEYTGEWQGECDY